MMGAYITTITYNRAHLWLPVCMAQAFAPAVLWNDSRAKDMERFITQRISPERYRHITGMPVSGSWAISKLVWLLHNRRDLMERARYICNGQEYFLRRLGAEVLESDPSALTLNGMLNIGKLDWSEEVCQAAGIDLARLPRVGRPGTMAGRLSEAAAEETELPAGIALCRGGGDQQCAAVGAGVIKQGLAEVTIGTSAMMVAHLEDPGLVKGPAPYIGGHAVPGKWDVEGGAFSIGSCLKWWRDNFGQIERSRAELEGSNTHRLCLRRPRRQSGNHLPAVFRRAGNSILRHDCARCVPRSGARS